MLSSFLLIAPAASTICFAQSAPQETTPGKQAKAAGAQTAPDASPQENSAYSKVDMAHAAPAGALNVAPSAAPGGTTNTANATTNSTSDYTKNFSTDYPQDYDTTIGPHLFPRFAKDQERIWTAPAHLQLVDVNWLLPLGVATGLTLATDTEVSKHLSDSPSRIKNANNFANYGIGSMAAVAGGLYLWGRHTHDDHKRETGFLAAEAAMDSLAVSYALKYAFGRERPLQGFNYQGKFWKGDQSFPSEHATAAWAIASVIAHEYPSPYVSLLSYGMAAAISAARVDGKQHFPTDVMIGSTIGWFVGQQVYRHHHDPEVGGGDWETYAESSDVSPARRTAPTGSPFVELDSWIYPAIERLAALGYIRLAFLGQRPWTRIECAHLVEEASDRIAFDGEGNSGQAAKLYYALQKEFASDLETAAGGGESEVTARLESVYSVTTGIDGPPLDDSRHFGQTIVNNYGRPYQEGINTYDGFSAYGGWGVFTLYVRGEYQHAPSAPGFSQSTQNLIATLDNTPVQQAAPIPATNQFRLLDTYIAAKVSDWNFAFGKQSLWWGPGEGSVLIFSDNAEPIYMFRASRVKPFVLPWIFRWLGPIKTDFFVGKLSENDFPPRPLVHGEVITLKPTPNLELGFSRTAEFGGVGRAITPSAVFNSYFDYFKSSVLYGPNDNPGKRYGGFYFNYRLPFVRDWLSIYSDSISDDDPSPLASPRRAGIDTGIYLTHFPKISKLDLRVESTNTNSVSSARNGQYIYYDAFYKDMYTNKGNIIGSWIGREGTGIQAWSNYWFTPKSSLQFGYRHATVAPDFIPQGESVNDEWVKGDFWIRGVLNVQASVQHETWLAPVLASTRQTNWTSSVGISYQPRNLEWPVHLTRQSSGNAQTNGVSAP